MRMLKTIIRIMVATDVVVALDIADVTRHKLRAITYEDYIHCIGCTGRANKQEWPVTSGM